MPKQPRALETIRSARRAGWLAPSAHDRLGIFTPTPVHPNLEALTRAFPQNGAAALDDQSLKHRVTVQLQFYQTRRDEHVSRADFKEAADTIKGAASILRNVVFSSHDEPTADDEAARLPLTAQADVLRQIDRISGRPTSRLLFLELGDFVLHLEQVLANEGERAAEPDQPGRQLVFELAAIFFARTGRKPSLLFSPKGTKRREAELDNPFEKFVEAVQAAHLDAVDASLARKSPTTSPLEKALREIEVARYALENVRAAIVFAVHKHRRQRWAQV